MAIKSLLERGDIPLSYWVIIITIIVISYWTSVYHTRKYNRTKENWEDGFTGDFAFVIFCFAVIVFFAPFIEHILIKLG